ncbi:hypothetical protein ACSSS7_005972 [Eimeria intestinalis]
MQQSTLSTSLPCRRYSSGGLSLGVEDRRPAKSFCSVVRHVATGTPEAVASVAALLPMDAERGQQQALHSLLQEIDSYSSSSSSINSSITKLSLKVYHWQQLAGISGATYLMLQQHPGVSRLVKDLTAAAVAANPSAAAVGGQELSPRQLHAMALCCCKLKLPANHPLWNGLAKQMLRHCKGGGLSVSEVSSSLRAFAAASAAIDLKHIAGLLQHVLRDVGRLNEYDAACLLFTVRKYRLNPVAEAHQQIQILSDKNPGGASGGPPSLACSSQAETIRATGKKQLEGTRKNKRKNSSNSSNSTSSSISGLSKLSLKVVRVCAWVLQQRGAAVTPKSLVCCLYEFGLLQLLPWRLLLLLRRRLRQQRQLQQLDSRGLALLAMSLSLLQQRETKISKRIGEALQQQLRQVHIHPKYRQHEQQPLVSNHSLCLLLHAIAQSNIREQLILQAACQRIEINPAEAATTAATATTAAAAAAAADVCMCF